MGLIHNNLRDTLTMFKDNCIAKCIDVIYPVGSIYFSLASTSPASKYGGEWQQIIDKFLVGAGGNYVAGTAGGSASHTHTTAGHALTITEMPSHTHPLPYRYSSNITAAEGSGIWFTDPGTSVGSSNTQSIASGGGASHSHGNTGSSSTIPPYFSVNIWQRVG